MASFFAKLVGMIETYKKFPFSWKQIVNRIHYYFSKKSIILSYRPIWLLIYVCDACNLKCKMCPTHTVSDVSNFEYQKENIGVMKKETYEIIMQKFPEATLVMLAWVWEPLLNPYFFDLISIWAKYKKMMNLVSNGILFNEDKIKLITKNKRFNQISISLNASTPEDYAEICNTQWDNICKVVENIKLLVRYKKIHKSNAQIIVSCVCSEQFLPKVYDFIVFANWLWVDRIDIHNYIDFEIKEKSNQWTLIENKKKIENQIKDIVSRIKWSNVKTPINFPKALDLSIYTKKCEWYFKNLSFDSYGNIWSCWRVMNPNSKYWNIFSQEDVWNNKYMQHMRKLFLNKNLKMPWCCTKCIENF